MKNYRESDYALNKYSEGIVYRFANETIELTLDDFLRKTPGATEATFLKWKAFSDSDYLLQAQKDNAQTKKNISIGALEETAACSVMSLEDEYIVAEDRERNLHMVFTHLCMVNACSLRAVARNSISLSARLDFMTDKSHHLPTYFITKQNFRQLSILKFLKNFAPPYGGGIKVSSHFAFCSS